MGTLNGFSVTNIVFAHLISKQGEGGAKNCRESVDTREGRRKQAHQVA